MYRGRVRVTWARRSSSPGEGTPPPPGELRMCAPSSMSSAHCCLGLRVWG